MTKALDDAVESVRRLPPSVPDQAAQMLRSFVNGNGPVLALGHEEEADLLEALAEAERGEVVIEADAQVVLANYPV